MGYSFWVDSEQLHEQVLLVSKVKLHSWEIYMFSVCRYSHVVLYTLLQLVTFCGCTDEITPLPSSTYILANTDSFIAIISVVACFYALLIQTRAVSKSLILESSFESILNILSHVSSHFLKFQVEAFRHQISCD